MLRRVLVFVVAVLALNATSRAEQITAAGQPAQLDIRPAGEHSVRITLKPVTFEKDFPYAPAVAEREYGPPAISLKEIDGPVKKRVGSLNVEVRPNPLTVVVTTAEGKPIQEITFQADGKLAFKKSREPVLGLGEGGPQPAPRGNFREAAIQFDRNGAQHQMIPRWESGAYGSRNPVPLMIGTEGWALFVATPWSDGIDLRGEDRGIFTPWQPPRFPAEGERRGTGQPDENAGKSDEPPQDAATPAAGGQTGGEAQPAGGNQRGQRGARGQRGQRRGGAAQGPNREALLKGRPPVDSVIPGAYDVFVFDAHVPAQLMKDISLISGPAVMPPKWSLGYMQSHRELEKDDAALVKEVDTFREKKIPVDAMIYLGTGFTDTGWNTRQPSLRFNPVVFKRDPKEVLDQMHADHVKVIVHVVPWNANRLPTLHGNIPPLEGETLDPSHIANYWKEHVDLVKTGVDAFWPDEGDPFNLFERVTRHQLYYQGPLSTQPDVRPWSLHRNGYLGIAKWGGWVWSGDTQSTWKTLEGQIAVGINHSLSLGPYWGSDTGGFYTTSELSGELYARWFQFSAFCPSFRSHGRIWRLRTPWGWGLSDWGPLENQTDLPRESEMNNPAIEPVCKKYDDLRYQLIPYTYTLAAEARETGLPFMRAMWLEYPDDEKGRSLGNQYLWGPDMLVAPVYTKGATSRDVYLPKGQWYDWWTSEKQTGGQTVKREVDLATMPLYVRAGAIIPFDPVRQYMLQPVEEPTTIRVYTGANGDFRWYEDDGQSQQYLSGKFAWTKLKWDDATKRLSIERDKSAGTLPATPRKLVIELLPAGTKREISYDGNSATVPFSM